MEVPAKAEGSPATLTAQNQLQEKSNEHVDNYWAMEVHGQANILFNVDRMLV